MADRFPLILNTSNNQIQEIASGDNLDLTGSGISNAGIITAGNVTIGAATTDLIVTGDARVTGILTIGTGSLTLNGPNNLVNVGTALTLGHTQGLQFHTQNLHSAGFEVNQINVSGASTIGGNLDANGDLDVDGHTNLDNLSVAGVATFTGNLNVGGVLTYEDVTNVDSVGIVTAREGVFLPDLKQLKLGNTAAAPDLYIWHNSSTGNSNISNKTGDLFIQGNNGSGTVVNQIAVKSNASVELNYQGTKKFETTGAGVLVSGNIYANDNNKFIAGTSNDLSIYHDGSHSYIDNNTGSLRFRDAGGAEKFRISGSGTQFNDDITLSNDNDKIIIGAGSDLQIFHTGTASKINNATGSLFIQSDATSFHGDGGSETMATFAKNGAVELYYDNTSRFSTSGVGATVYGNLDVTADLDVDGHTNLDNVNVSGVCTVSSNIYTNGRLEISSSQPRIHLVDTDNNDDFSIYNNHGTFLIYDSTDGADRFKIDSSGNITMPGDTTFSGGAGAITIAADSDIRMVSGNWTGEYSGKIQYHSNKIYIQSGAGGWQFRTAAGAAALELSPAGLVTGNISFANDVNFNSAGAGAITIAAGGDIRMGDGAWSGEHAGKIQFHSNRMYLQGGTSGHQLRDPSGGTTIEILTNGNISGQNLTMAQDVLFNGGAGACTIKAHADIRLETGNWTGNTYGKIQHHADSFYICGGSNANYAIILRDNNADRIYMTTGGTFYPTTNNYSDLGTSVNRWRNIYTNDLNLSNKDGANDVDGTWGNYTIQEGESDLFLINNRNGKKYKFNLTEVN